jgi:hypothetical protein
MKGGENSLIQVDDNGGDAGEMWINIGHIHTLLAHEAHVHITHIKRAVARKKTVVIVNKHKHGTHYGEKRTERGREEDAHGGKEGRKGNLVELPDQIVISFRAKIEH